MRQVILKAGCHMFTRKIFAAIIVSFIAIPCLTLVESFYDSFSVEDGELILVLFFYSIYFIPIIFIYGIIISLIAEKISRKVTQFKQLVSFGLHLLGGAGFIIPYILFIEYNLFPVLTVLTVITHPVNIFSALFAIIFIEIDNILSRKNSKKQSIPI